MDRLIEAFWKDFVETSDVEHVDAAEDEPSGPEWATVEVDRRCRSGDLDCVPLLVALVEGAPVERDGWLSYLEDGPIRTYWESTNNEGRLRLSSASQTCADLKEVLIFFGYIVES